MSKYDLTMAGYRFRYNSGSFVIVNKAETPDLTPYDMMQIPDWVNASRFDESVLMAIGREWLERYGPAAPNEVDNTELRAHILHAALLARGIPNAVHWDRSPWGVRIPLITVADAGEITDEDIVPSLYVMTEGTQEKSWTEKPVWVWGGQLGDFDDNNSMDLSDTGFEWIERHWLNDYTESVADMLVPIVQILTLGAAKAAEARRFRVSAQLDPWEIETALRTLAEIHADGTEKFLSSVQKRVADKVLGLAPEIQ